jgi:hypothetical protein
MFSGCCFVSQVETLVLSRQLSGKGHPITYNHYFTETVQKARQGRRKKKLKNEISSWLHVVQPSFYS